MASVDFQVRNGIIANTYFIVGNSSVNTVITPTSITFTPSMTFNSNSSTTAMFIANNGNVGIGTSSPTAKLDVLGSTRIGALNSVTHPNANSNGGAWFQWNQTSGNGENDIYNIFTSAAESFRFWQTTGNGTAQSLYSMATGGHVWYISNTERMRIDASGNVGIGTTSPAATLDVVGTVNTSKANTLSQTLTDGVTVSWDTSLGQIATVTLAGNRTIAAPTNLKVSTYLLHVIQDATGSRTLTWNSIFKWPAGTAPPLTTTANARDIFSFVSDGTNLYGSFLPNVK